MPVSVVVGGQFGSEGKGRSLFTLRESQMLRLSYVLVARIPVTPVLIATVASLFSDNFLHLAYQNRPLLYCLLAV